MDSHPPQKKRKNLEVEKLSNILSILQVSLYFQFYQVSIHGGLTFSKLLGFLEHVEKMHPGVKMPNINQAFQGMVQ